MKTNDVASYSFNENLLLLQKSIFVLRPPQVTLLINFNVIFIKEIHFYI